VKFFGKNRKYRLWQKFYYAQNSHKIKTATKNKNLIGLICGYLRRKNWEKYLSGENISGKENKELF
jgi:hypothetical protein